MIYQTTIIVHASILGRKGLCTTDI